jgi:hypothetical protein
MASEIRVNQIQNRSGLSTVTFSDTGVVISGITTISDLRTSGTTIVAAGTTSAPSISPTGDSNTGIFFPSADTVAIAEGGVEAFRITSTGQLQATGAADVRLTLGSGGTAGTNDSVHIRADGANLKFMNASGGATIFEQNGTERLRIDSSGRVTTPYQPFFYAKAGASRDNQTSNPTVFNNVVTNVGNHYDGTTNYRFTAPVAGVYLFTSQPGYKETSDDASWKLYKNGAAFTDFVRVLGGLTSHSGWSCAALVYLNVNEYVHIGWDGSAGGYHQNSDMSYFSGVLIG